MSPDRRNDIRVCTDFTPVELAIVAGGTARLMPAKVNEFRKTALLGFPNYLSSQFLRHSDGQTVASLVAISEAIRSGNMTNNQFQDWAIVSSSRQLGRSQFAGVINKYQDEGPWGVSVQVIPHCSPHSIASTISLALQSHGPCIGVGCENDAMFSAACILRRSDWFRAWIVFSAWSPEPSIDSSGIPLADSTCLAAAIAVTRRWTACSLGRIRFTNAYDLRSDTSDLTNGSELNSGFADFLVGHGGMRRLWSSPPTSAIRIHVELNGDNWCDPIQSTHIGHERVGRVRGDNPPSATAKESQQRGGNSCVNEDRNNSDRLLSGRI
jgi:hypothetical protein